ncbi:MAG: MFS transporter [Alphaproteobacteria bacterium]
MTAASPLPRWRGVAAYALGTGFFFYAFLHRVAPSVMVEPLMAEFAVGGAVLGNLSAFYFYAYSGLQLPVGILMARFGVRRLLLGAALVAAGGSVVFALSGTLSLAYLGRTMIGAGSAFGWVATLALATRHLPPERFAMLTGILQAVGMVGGMFGQAPLGIAVEAMGWRGAIALLAGLGIVLAAALWLVIPRDHGRTVPRGALSAGLARVARNRQTWIIAGVGLSLTAPMLAFAGLWGVPYLMTRFGLDRPEAAAILSLNFIGWAVGAPLNGLFSDRWRRRRPFLIGGGLVATASIAAILYLPGMTLVPLAVLVLVNGLAASSIVVTYATAREVNPPDVSSAVYGLINAAVTGSGAIFQPLIGWLLDLGWDGTTAAGARLYAMPTYDAALAVMPAAGIVGIGLALAVRETHGRQGHG